MNKKAVWWTACMIFLLSCQKESNNIITAGTLLVRSVEKTGSDSVAIDYSYDMNDRLVLLKTSGVQGGNSMNGELKIYRQSSGAIFRTVEKAAYLSTNGVDSIITEYNYDAGSGRYTSSVLVTIGSAPDVRDSVVYDYDASGRISRDNHFQVVAGVPFLQKFKQEYVYTSAGNIDSVKNFYHDPVSNVYSLEMILDYEYDAKVNPLEIKNESVILYQFPFCGPNNMQVNKVTYPSNPSMNYLASSVFVYNDKNHPASAVTTKTPGSPSNSVFYYQ